MWGSVCRSKGVTFRTIAVKSVTLTKTRKRMSTQNLLIRFDWAMKRLLRQKSNHAILEGFLSELLRDDIKIEQILESESNQDTGDDKFNRVDILALNARQELIIIEVQNSRQVDYFQRMLYGVSKATIEHLSVGEPYRNIKKVYSVNIVYFDLGQGQDYVYHGKTEFIGVHNGDTLSLSDRQKELFEKDALFRLFPEYYVLKINNFNDKAHDSLDEWIYYLKNNEIPQGASARGLKEVDAFLRVQALNDADRSDYYRQMENRRLEVSLLDTARIEGRALGEKESKEEIALKMKHKGFDNKTIADLTGLSEGDVARL